MVMTLQVRKQSCSDSSRRELCLLLGMLATDTKQARISIITLFSDKPALVSPISKRQLLFPSMSVSQIGSVDIVNQAVLVLANIVNP